jgi:N-acetylmuramoyl-L-alanine amidase
MRAARSKPVEFVVVHCSATPPSRDIGAADIDTMHKARGWKAGIGYHLVIRRDGRIEAGEHLNSRGAHAVGFNDNSISVCLVGGVDAKNKPEANFTEEQWDSLKTVASLYKKMFPKAKFVGHRDLSPDKDGDGEIEPWEWLKACPTFDVKKWAKENGF